MTSLIHKADSTSYDLVVQGLVSDFSRHVLSTLFEKDYALMIEHMEQMQVSKHLPVYYHFPRYKTAPEIDVRLVRNIMEYQLILNVGMRILSEMTNDEFDVVLYECKQLPSQVVGSKVYFPPVKDIFKK